MWNRIIDLRPIERCEGIGSDGKSLKFHEITVYPNAEVATTSLSRNALVRNCLAK